MDLPDNTCILKGLNSSYKFLIQAQPMDAMYGITKAISSNRIKPEHIILVANVHLINMHAEFHGLPFSSL